MNELEREKCEGCQYYGQLVLPVRKKGIKEQQHKQHEEEEHELEREKCEEGVSILRSL